MEKDKERLLMYFDITRIAIVICWITLISFWLLKIFGGNFFKIMVENENFLKFSQALQNTWLKYLVSFLTISLVNFFRFGCVCEKLCIRGNYIYIYFIANITMWTVSNFVKIDIIQMLYGGLFIIIFSFIVKNKFKKIYGLICCILEFAFLTISMIIRNVPLYVSENYFTSLLLSIDVYLMFLLYYLYVNLNKIKKEI